MERNKQSFLLALLGCAMTVWLLLFIAHGAMFDTSHSRKYRRSISPYYDGYNHMVFNDAMQNTVNEIGVIQQSVGQPQKSYATSGKWDGRLGYQERITAENSYRTDQQLQSPSYFGNNHQQAWNPYAQRPVQAPVERPVERPVQRPAYPNFPHNNEDQGLSPWNQLPVRHQQNNHATRHSFQSNQRPESNQGHHQSNHWPHTVRANPAEQSQFGRRYPQRQVQHHVPTGQVSESHRSHRDHQSGYPGHNGKSDARSPSRPHDSGEHPSQPDMRRYGKAYKVSPSEARKATVETSERKAESQAPPIPPVPATSVKDKPEVPKSTSNEDPGKVALKQLKNILLISKTKNAKGAMKKEVLPSKEEPVKGKVVFQNVEKPPALIPVKITGKPRGKGSHVAKSEKHSKDLKKAYDAVQKPVKTQGKVDGVDPKALTAMAFLHHLALYSQGLIQKQAPERAESVIPKPEATTQATLLMLSQGRARSASKLAPDGNDHKKGATNSGVSRKRPFSIEESNFNSTFLAAMKALADIVNNMHAEAENVPRMDSHKIMSPNRIETTTPPLAMRIANEKPTIDANDDMRKSPDVTVTPDAWEITSSSADSQIESTSTLAGSSVVENARSSAEAVESASASEDSVVVAGASTAADSRAFGNVSSSADSKVVESVPESPQTDSGTNIGIEVESSAGLDFNNVEGNALDEDPLSFIERMALLSTFSDLEKDFDAHAEPGNPSNEGEVTPKADVLDAIDKLSAALNRAGQEEMDVVSEVSSELPSSAVERDGKFSEEENKDEKLPSPASVIETFAALVKRYTDGQPMINVTVEANNNKNETPKADNASEKSANIEIDTIKRGESDAVFKLNLNTNDISIKPKSESGKANEVEKPKNSDEDPKIDLVVNTNSSPSPSSKPSLAMFDDNPNESSGFGEDETEGLGARKEIVPGMMEVTGEPLYNPIKDKKKQKEFRFILKRAANARKEVMLVFFDGGYFDFALNFAEMSVKPNDLTNVVFISLDSNGCQELRELYMWCFVTSYNNDKIEGSVASSYGDDTYWMKVNARHIYILEALMQGYIVLHVDPDVHLFSDPFIHFHNSSADIQGMLDGVSAMNIGFIYVKPTRYAVGFFSDFVRLIRHSPALNEQGVFNMLLGLIAGNTYSFDFEYVDPEKFVNGKVYYDEAKRYFYGDHPSCTKCVAVHNNHIIGKAGKIYRFKENLQWGVDTDNYYSDSDRKYLAYENPIALADADKSLQYEIAALRDALAIGFILNRTLILPRFHCANKSICPLNSYLLMEEFDNIFGERYRENVFLENPLVPEDVFRSESKTFYINTNTSMPLSMDLPKDVAELSSSSTGQVTSNEIKDWFGSLTESILKIHSLYGTYVKFGDSETESKFNGDVMKAFKRGTYEQNPL